MSSAQAFPRFFRTAGGSLRRRSTWKKIVANFISFHFRGIRTTPDSGIGVASKNRLNQLEKQDNFRWYPALPEPPEMPFWGSIL
jgi:hypothetical protein